MTLSTALVILLRLVLYVFISPSIFFSYILQVMVYLLFQNSCCFNCTEIVLVLLCSLFDLYVLEQNATQQNSSPFTLNVNLKHRLFVILMSPRMYFIECQYVYDLLASSKAPLAANNRVCFTNNLLVAFCTRLLFFHYLVFSLNRYCTTLPNNKTLRQQKQHFETNKTRKVSAKIFCNHNPTKGKETNERWCSKWVWVVSGK